MNSEQIMNAMSDEQLAEIVGLTLYAGVRPLVDNGMTAQMALRLVSATYVSEALGRKALEEMGVPPSTARRWRTTLKRYMEKTPDTPPQAVVEDVKRYVEQKSQDEQAAVAKEA
jgi:hypothetical protein